MTNTLSIKLDGGGLVFSVKVIFNASCDQIVGLLGNALKIKTVVLFESGKANKAIIAILANSLNISMRDISIVVGCIELNKTIRINGIGVGLL